MKFFDQKTHRTLPQIQVFQNVQLFSFAYDVFVKLVEFSLIRPVSTHDSNHSLVVTHPVPGQAATAGEALYNWKFTGRDVQGLFEDWRNGCLWRFFPIDVHDVERNQAMIWNVRDGYHPFFFWIAIQFPIWVLDGYHR